MLNLKYLLWWIVVDFLWEVQNIATMDNKIKWNVKRVLQLQTAANPWHKEDDKKETQIKTYEPSHEIMVLFVLRKLILQTRLRSHPVGLDVGILVGPFVYFHTSCVRTAKALARLRGWAGSPEPSLVAYVISTIISWAGSYRRHKQVHETHTDHLSLSL